MRSDPLKKGINAAPQRALLKALGLCDAEIERPLIGVVSSQNDIVPGHVFLDKITDAVKQGVALGGGVPIVFPAIAVCDGLAMGHKGMKYSLVSRELIADSVEAMATAHPFDGLVLVAACDKGEGAGHGAAEDGMLHISSGVLRAGSARRPCPVVVLRKVEDDGGGPPEDCSLSCGPGGIRGEMPFSMRALSVRGIRPWRACGPRFGQRSPCGRRPCRWRGSGTRWRSSRRCRCR